MSAMCGTVILPDGDSLGCLRDLEEAGFEIVAEDRVDSFDGEPVADDYCFCCVDPEPILKRSGRPYTFDPVFGDFCVTA